MVRFFLLGPRVDVVKCAKETRDGGNEMNLRFLKPLTLLCACLLVLGCSDDDGGNGGNNNNISNNNNTTTDDTIYQIQDENHPDFNKNIHVRRVAPASLGASGVKYCYTTSYSVRAIGRRAGGQRGHQPGRAFSGSYK